MISAATGLRQPTRMNLNLQPSQIDNFTLGTPVLRDNLDENRIASPEMLPTGDLLPHVICSPPVFAGGGEHEADQHDDA